MLAGALARARRSSCASTRPARVAVVPSFFEGFGFPASEAMACGLPVVANAAGALPEVVGTDGRAGRLVPPRDPQRARRRDRATLARRPARASRAMGRAARARVERRFRWSDAAARARVERASRRRCRAAHRRSRAAWRRRRATCSSTRAAARGATASARSSAARAWSASTSTSPRCASAAGALRFRGARSAAGSARCSRATPSACPSPTRRFDRVICSEVMEHVHDYRAAARELARVTQARRARRRHDPDRDQRAPLPAPRRRLLREPGRPHPHLPRRASSRAALAAAGLATEGVGFAHALPHALLGAALGRRACRDADASRLVRAYRAVPDPRDDVAARSRASSACSTTSARRA